MADVGITFRIQGSQQVVQAVQQLSAQAVQVKQKFQESTQTLQQHGTAIASVRQTMLNFSQTISGAAAVLSILARNNREMQRNLEVLSLTMSGFSTVMRTAAASIRLVSSLLTPQITILAAVAAAVFYLIRHWEQAKEVAFRVWGGIKDFFVRLGEGLANLFRGLAQVVVGFFIRDIERMRAGQATLAQGLGQLKDIAVDLGENVKRLVLAGWEKLTQLFGQTAEKAKQAATSMADFLKGLPLEAQQAWINMSERWAAAASSLYGALGPLITRFRFLKQETPTALPSLKGAGGPFADVEKVRLEMDKLREAVVGVGKDLSGWGKIGQVTELFSKLHRVGISASEAIRQDWARTIGEIAARSQSLAEFMTNLWEGIKQSIIRKMAEAVATSVFGWAKQFKLSSVLPFPFNLLAGLFGLQHGGELIVTRPTLLPVGEAGAEKVRVSPLAGGPTTMAGAVHVRVDGPSLWDELTYARFVRRLARDLQRELGWRPT